MKKRNLSEAAKEHKAAYDTQYILSNIVQKRINFNKQNPEDMKRLEHLENQPNQNQYVKGLIDKDMTGE